MKTCIIKFPPVFDCKSNCRLPHKTKTKKNNNTGFYLFRYGIDTDNVNFQEESCGKMEQDYEYISNKSHLLNLKYFLSAVPPPSKESSSCHDVQRA